MNSSHNLDRQCKVLEQMHSQEALDTLGMTKFRQMQEHFANQLSACEPGQELSVLHNALKPDDQELWNKCMEVKTDILLAFQPHHPNVQLKVFGSTVMGIAFKGTI